MQLKGSPRLLSRPLSVYEEIAEKQGLTFERGPEGLTVCGRLKPGTFPVEGGISSQFISGLLFALPLLEEDSRIELIPPVESRSYIAMTREALRRFGVRTEQEGENTLLIPGRQRCTARTETVEGDWSNAAFFLAMGLDTEGLEEDSLQGDRVCREYFRALEQGRAELDLSDCPDLGPVLFAFAALHHGGVFTGTRRLRLKESDRGEAMKQELAKFGIKMAVEEDRITVGCGVRPPEEELCGHNDHRIVMALSVLCVQTGGTIRGAEAVAKSFPDYFTQLKNTGVRMEIEDGMDIEE
jgi:3-phosphoshikimate 1-carboxyvinyltransferase